MKEIKGNLWDYHIDHIVVITTNGTVNSSGQNVMGRGCAFEAKKRIPSLPLTLGKFIKDQGNHVFTLCHGLVSFPVKHNWWENADINLIERSAQELSALTDHMGWSSVIIPRPGCGNGRLKWIDVKPVIEPYLDDRFSIISHG